MDVEGGQELGALDEWSQEHSPDQHVEHVDDHYFWDVVVLPVAELVCYDSKDLIVVTFVV